MQAVLTGRTVLVIGANQSRTAVLAGQIAVAGAQVVTCNVRDESGLRSAFAGPDTSPDTMVTLTADAAELPDVNSATAVIAGLMAQRGHGLIVHLCAPSAEPAQFAEGVRTISVIGQEGIDGWGSLGQFACLLISDAASEIRGQIHVTGSPAATRDDAIVVVGMGLAIPGASTPEQFWTLLNQDEPVFGEPGDRLDVDSIWSPDPDAPDKTYSRVSGFMKGFQPHPQLRREIADGMFPTEEHTALWLRHSLLSAAENVAIRPGDRQLFTVGLTPDGSQHLEHSLIHAGVHELEAATGHTVSCALDTLYPLAAASPEDVLPYRIARMAAFDLPESAEITVVDTACSSSLYAIDLGVRALRSGEADVAMSGGAFALSAQNMVLFSKLRGLSKSGRVRPLDQGADGVLFSDSAAVVILKTYSRAVADKDTVLGFVAGFGGSSDGRGKAIYAPNAAGQLLALDRAWSSAGVKPDDLDWVVAHATGTPTGDRTEMAALIQSAGQGKIWTITSNKSLVGHSGWAAGTVSVIHALLAMQHETIPGQRQFAALPDDLNSSVSVPVRDLPWPCSPGRPRAVGVSAMGFGGTNGHLILTDQPVSRITRPSPHDDDPVVVVTYGVHAPGDPGDTALDGWLSGSSTEWPATFGEDYPALTPAEARLAPSAIAAMDRSQMMALRCADLIAGAWAQDEQLSARTGVIIGHTGPTRSAIRYGLRYSLDELLAQNPTGPAAELIRQAVHGMTRPINEDVYPGVMPNVIAARVTQRLDLHGPNMTVDAGRDSANSALATALRYLRDGELDMAVVMGINATTEHVHAHGGREVAEAAVGFVLTRLSLARDLGLAALGTLDLQSVIGGGQEATAGPETRDYRGASGAVMLLRALRGGSERVVLAPAEDSHTPPLLVTRCDPARPVAGKLDHLTRNTLTLRPVPPRQVRERLPAIPPGSLVLTDDPRDLARAGIPEDCLVVVPSDTSPSEPDGTTPPFALVHTAGPEVLAQLLSESDRAFSHIRVVITGRHETLSQILALHDLAFVAAKAHAAQLRSGGSYAVLVLDGLDRQLPRPHAGLFSGLVRSLCKELPGCLTYAQVTDVGDLATGLVQLADESAAHRAIPVAYSSGGLRLESMLLPVEAPPPGKEFSLPSEPVIVATGGARGLTAHLVHELVAAGPPQGVWLLGTGAAPTADSDPRALPPRPEALRDLMSRFPGETPAQLSRRYDRMLQDSERVRTIEGLREACGANRVHYRQCDVLDDRAVSAVIEEILAVEGRVDVIVHGAGLARSAGLERKKLADFQAVRDVKVRGYANLKTALGTRQPALWCSISSVSAFNELEGEPDYCAANEFLLLAAASARARNGLDEVAFVSGLWVESGMASADTPGGAFLARKSEISQLTDEQGREFFRTELRGRGSHGLATTWIGDADWTSMEHLTPGFRQICVQEAQRCPEPSQVTARPSMLAGRRAFLAGPSSGVGAERAWTFGLRLDDHPYLLDHLVDGRPTVPATFILEMAAEAAAELAPDMLPVRITDVVLSQFIRAARHRWPRTLQVTAVREGTKVRVHVLTPAASPVPEREHTRMVVHLARSVPPSPWCPPPPAGGADAPNTYELPGTPVELSGVFGSLERPRLEPDGGSAEFRLKIPHTGAPFKDFILPSVALDCLLRTAILDGRAPGDVPVVVPTALDSVELYTQYNDLELAESWPSGLTLRHWFASGTGTGQAALLDPHGRALLQVTGLHGATRALLDPRSQTWKTGSRLTIPASPAR